jgi:arginase family enzyme
MLRENTQTSTPTTERFAYFEDFNVFDAGNFTGGTREEMFEEVRGYVKGLVEKGIRFTMIGGDHSVTIPVQRGIDDAVDEVANAFFGILGQTA